MTGRYCYTIYDDVQCCWLPGEFECLHDCLERIKELEIDYNAPDRFKYNFSYVYNMED